MNVRSQRDGSLQSDWYSLKYCRECTNLMITECDVHRKAVFHRSESKQSFLIEKSSYRNRYSSSFCSLIKRNFSSFADERTSNVEQNLFVYLAAAPHPLCLASRFSFCLHSKIHSVQYETTWTHRIDLWREWLNCRAYCIVLTHLVLFVKGIWAGF